MQKTADLFIHKNNKNLKFTNKKLTDKKKDKLYKEIIDAIKELQSIIILTYNNWQDTEVCIESIIEKTKGQDYELIIIDNASQDVTT